MTTARKQCRRRAHDIDARHDISRLHRSPAYPASFMRIGQIGSPRRVSSGKGAHDEKAKPQPACRQDQKSLRHLHLAFSCINTPTSHISTSFFSAFLRFLSKTAW